MANILDIIKNKFKSSSKEGKQPIVIIKKEEPISFKEGKVEHIGQLGLHLIKNAEGLRLNAYPDPASGGDPWTIGYGHTGPEVKKGLIINELQAETYLKQDCLKFEKEVIRLVKVKLTQGQFDALVSFCYNLGPGALAQSTLLKKLNSGDINGAADQFLAWNKARIGGVLTVMPGLDKRRKSERALFLS